MVFYFDYPNNFHTFVAEIRKIILTIRKVRHTVQTVNKMKTSNNNIQSLKSDLLNARESWGRNRAKECEYLINNTRIDNAFYNSLSDTWFKFLFGQVRFSEKQAYWLARLIVENNKEYA